MRLLETRKQPAKENAGDGEGEWGLRGVHREKVGMSGDPLIILCELPICPLSFIIFK